MRKPLPAADLTGRIWNAAAAAFGPQEWCWGGFELLWKALALSSVPTAPQSLALTRCSSGTAAAEGQILIQLHEQLGSPLEAAASLLSE